MNHRSISFIRAAETGWVWLYTAGMQRPVAGRRREELASTMWDYQAWAKGALAPWPVPLHALWQFAGGIPIDLVWRLQAGKATLCKRSLDELWAAVLIIIGVVVVIPVCLVFMGLASADMENGSTGTTLGLVNCAFAAGVAFAYGLSATCLYDRFPVASGIVGAIGAAAVAISCWWISVLAAALGAVALVMLGLAVYNSVEHTRSTGAGIDN